MANQAQTIEPVQNSRHSAQILIFFSKVVGSIPVWEFFPLFLKMSKIGIGHIFIEKRESNAE